MHLRPLIQSLLFLALALGARAEEPAAEAAQHANSTAAAAAVSTGQVPRSPDFLEHLLDGVLARFDVRSSENTLAHYVVAMLFLVAALLLRRVVTGFIFKRLKKLAERTATTLDDKLVVAALQGNAGAGGVILALAADQVWARPGVVLNPHYQGMSGLYGSEYWTYLLPKRVVAKKRAN